MKSVSEAQGRAWLSQLMWMLVDLALWLVMLWVARWVRNDLEGPASLALDAEALLVTVGTLGTAVLVGSFSGLYSPIRRVWPGSPRETVVLFLVHLTAAVVGFVLAAIAMPGELMPRSTPLIAGAFVLGIATIARAVWRWAWPQLRPGPRPERILIFGAGSRAFQLLNTLPAANQSRRVPYRPVALFADEESAVGKLIHGIRALPTTEKELQSTIERTAATSLLIVTDEPAEPETIEMIKSVCDDEQVRVLVLPGESELTEIEQQAPLGAQLREINVSDLIGREALELDESGLQSVLEGRRVLVTGAGGSIGSELCRQVHRFNPAELIMLDRDEGGLHATQLSLTNTALLDGRDTVLTDIRDVKTLKAIFLERRPEVVLHAAALKHQPLLERYPTEAVQTNVLGTQNVLDAAAHCGAEIVVNVSTDKAANPTSVLGQSKRVAERLTAEMARKWPAMWVSVRFGNVFGSRGSVIETFNRQIEEGGPVTVTDPEVERFFMTIPEAAQLVLQATAVGRSGETLVLEMGKPVKISELARSLIRLHGKEDIVEIVYTGLRPGEKISEELVDDRETPQVGDRHELITEVTVAPYALSEGVRTATHDEDAARRFLERRGGSGIKASAGSRAQE